MIFFLNYSTCTTPISVLPLPNLHRMQQLNLHYFHITAFLPASINLAFPQNCFLQTFKILHNFFHPTLTFIFFIFPSTNKTSLLPANFFLWLTQCIIFCCSVAWISSHSGTTAFCSIKSCFKPAFFFFFFFSIVPSARQFIIM